MSSGNSTMILETGTGWSRGLSNLLRSELGRWFGTKQWWVQVLIQAGIAAGAPLLIAVGTKELPVEQTVVLFNVFLSMCAPIALCIIMQESLVGEKRSGTAAWLLSKPLSRLAFMAGKFTGNTLGIILTMVLIPGLVMYAGSALLLDVTLAPLGYALAMGVHVVHLLFYVGLTLLLGALSDSGGAVIGLPLLFLFGQQFLPSLHPALIRVLPWSLAGIAQAPSVTTGLMTGVPPAVGYLPVVTTAAATVLFIATAVWAFHRQDL